MGRWRGELSMSTWVALNYMVWRRLGGFILSLIVMENGSSTLLKKWI